MNELFQLPLLSEDEAGVDPKEIKEPKTLEDKVEKPEDKKEKVEVKEEVVDKTEPVKLQKLSPEEAGLNPEDLENQDNKSKNQKKASKKEVESAISYKEIAEYFIDQEEWIKPDNWDEVKDAVEWTPELFADFQKRQFQAKVSQAIEEERGSFGQNYSELLKYAKDGGKFEDLLPSYQEQVEIEALDPTDPDQAEKIERAYCEAMGWSAKKINGHIESLKDKGEDELKSYASESKESLVRQIKEDREESIKRQEALAERDKAIKETFTKKVKEALYNSEETPEREKKDNFDFYTKYKYQDDKGNKFTEMDKILMEIQNDPAKFAKYIYTLKNFDKVEDKKKVEKQVKKDVFSFLRGSQDFANKTSDFPESKNKNNKNTVHWDFSSV